MVIKTVSLTKKKMKNILIRTMILIVVVFIMSGYMDLFESAVEFVHDHENLELDEIFIVAIITVAWLLIEQVVLIRHIYKSSQNYEQISMIDEMTKLYNWRVFFIRVEEMINELSEKETKGVLLYFDIDKFKKINDTYGHHIGDDVLIKFASILLNLNTKKVVSGRIGGDEFVVFIQNDSDSFLKLYQENIKLELKNFKNFMDFGINVSMGQAMYPDDSIEIDGLLSFADIKMYKDKKSDSSKTTDEII